MENKEHEYLSETFVKCFAMPNCSKCKHFELLTVFEYCNLHDKITEGKICNGFRIKDADA
jgi:hypothetical protein